MIRSYLVLGYIATIVLANWLVQHYGIVPVGFGLEAPAAVFAAGFAFSFRDGVQRYGGRHYVVAVIVVGSLVSYLIAPSFAVASCVAFLVSELLDMAVYTPLARRHALVAILASNTVGAVVDSYLFLTIAFGSLAYFWGQVVGKLWTIIPVVVGVVIYRAVSKRSRQRAIRTHDRLYVDSAYQEPSGTVADMGG